MQKPGDMLVYSEVRVYGADAGRNNVYRLVVSVGPHGETSYLAADAAGMFLQRAHGEDWSTYRRNYYELVRAKP